MAHQLTLRGAASLDSISSSETTPRPTAIPDQGERLGSSVYTPFPTTRRVAAAQSGDTASGTASTPLGNRKAAQSSFQRNASSVNKKEKRENRTGNSEKPLPHTPLSPPARTLPRAASFEPLDTLKEVDKRAGNMSRGTPGGSMDSLSSAPPTQMYSVGKSPTAYLADANSSQSSIASSSQQTDTDGEEAAKDLVTPRSAAPSSAGPSPSVQQRASGNSNTQPAPATSSTHLSGLMCNVHRTTGREPHALVGATTTILGDKLYVFGGKILSRTRAALTSDLYELDLIRRHWTKLEPQGDFVPPRYFHSMCSLGDTKLVCYGGMSPSLDQQATPAAMQNGQEAQPEVVVMSDIHIYDTATNTWSFIATQDTPQGRYAHCATILPSSAIFSSANAPMSAIHHNPSSGNPNQGSIGVNLDGNGGAEMVVVGGQDSANHYIEQISVFNLRSLKWTSTQHLGKSCGAYRSVVAPLPASVTAKIGRNSSTKTDNSTQGSSQEPKDSGSSMLIYSNYNFLDVKLELQIRSPDGTLTEKPMQGSYTPPGLRFPNGGVIDTNFVVSGTYLTSSKQEYALWALDLRNLTWSRIDAGGAVFGQGSWNRGVLWNRRNTFVILGNRKRSLVEDYNHRRLNFSNVCMVELEAFGLYDNPRKTSPTSGFLSSSSPAPSIPLPLTPHGPGLDIWSAGGRTLSKAAEDLGTAALAMKELADMEILAIGGERIPVNSRIIARRWGPYFVQLLREGTATQDGNDAATLRGPSNNSIGGASSNATLFTPQHNPSRNSTVTITPFSGGGSGSSFISTATTLHDGAGVLEGGSQNGNRGAGQVPAADFNSLTSPPDAQTLAPTSRPRTLYLPHTYLTLQSLLHFLYTSSLPPSPSPLCTPQILCSLLQIARPYRVDGLVEAVVERLHSLLDSRNAAAVFNAAAMAAGGARGVLSEAEVEDMFDSASAAASGLAPLSVVTANLSLDAETDAERTPNSALSSASSSVWEGSESGRTPGLPAAGLSGVGVVERGLVWMGGVSPVIGLQKRGLRGLMEGRRLRERGGSLGGSASAGGNGGGMPQGSTGGNGHGNGAGSGSASGLGKEVQHGMSISQRVGLGIA